MAKLKNPKLKTSSEKFQKNNLIKSLSLFDHVNQISKIQDPEYFNNLTEMDKKSFDHYRILQALSMNPNNLNSITIAYRFFNSIPSAQFYKLLISIIKPYKTWYPWIKKKKRNNELIGMVSRRFEVTNLQAEEYINLLFLTKEGMNSLVYICQEFGKSDKEIEQLLSINDDE